MVDRLLRTIYNLRPQFINNHSALRITVKRLFENMKIETYFGYTLTYEECRFLNNQPLWLWVARKEQGHSKLPFVTLRSETKAGLKQLIKRIIR